MPIPHPTKCAFGGPALDVLAVTMRRLHSRRTSAPPTRMPAACFDGTRVRSARLPVRGVRLAPTPATARRRRPPPVLTGERPSQIIHLPQVKRRVRGEMQHTALSWHARRPRQSGTRPPALGRHLRQRHLHVRHRQLQHRDDLGARARVLGELRGTIPHVTCLPERRADEVAQVAGDVQRQGSQPNW